MTGSSVMGSMVPGSGLLSSHAGASSPASSQRFLYRCVRLMADHLHTAGGGTHVSMQIHMDTIRNYVNIRQIATTMRPTACGWLRTTCTRRAADCK